MNKKVLVMISPVSAQRLNGVAHYAREQGWYLMIQDRIGSRPLAWEGDGVIVALRSDNTSVNAVRRFRARGIPVVDVTISRPEVVLPRVMSDHEAIGRMAAEHFAERNFRNLAWFSTGWGHVQELRYSGFTEKSVAMKWVAAEATYHYASAFSDIVYNVAFGVVLLMFGYWFVVKRRKRALAAENEAVQE